MAATKRSKSLGAMSMGFLLLRISPIRRFHRPLQDLGNCAETLFASALLFDHAIAPGEAFEHSAEPGVSGVFIESLVCSGPRF
jgi:hypothetical protein